ncbi:MAG: response regulator [Methanoregula sp.]|jgi:PAS domain S-box-containing protein|nr:response regulator [Methanoregula sp.]
MVHVLYVDDEECLLEICQAFLKRVGDIDVDTAASVDEGLQLMALKEYDAIISDYEMPEKNGIDFLKEIRSQGNRIPFIVFTGRGREEIVIEAFNHGADFYLQKGGEPKSQFAELAHKVRQSVDRRQNELALEHSNSLLKATLESTADGILVVESDRTITTFNQKFLQMWGISENSPVIRTEQDFLTYVQEQVTDYPAFEKPILMAAKKPQSGSYDIVHCHDGRMFRRFSQAQMIKDRIVGRVWSFRDITGQNRAELELRAACEQLAATDGELKQKYAELETSSARIRESEEKYRGVFRAGTYPLFLVDRESLAVLDLNDAASALYGYGREDILNMSLHHLSAETVQTTDEIGLVNTDVFVHFHRKMNGTIFPAEISASRFSIGNRPVFIVAIRDITRAKQIENALRLSNVKLNLLLGITRHDILNKLSALHGYNELLATSTADPQLLVMLDKQKKATDSIKKQIDFTREYDQLGVKSPQWHQVNEIAGRAYSQILQTIAFTCDTGNLEVYADPMLEKVFYNLFDNSFRYGGEITPIDLTWARAGGDLVIRVEDNGTGIPDSDKERIFEKGYGRNTGLGLYLTREILSITGMKIKETGEYCKGARFEIRVPEGNFRFLQTLTGSQDYGNQMPIFAGE